MPLLQVKELFGELFVVVFVCNLLLHKIFHDLLQVLVLSLEVLDLLDTAAGDVQQRPVSLTMSCKE